MRVHYINSTTKANIRPPFESDEFNDISNTYNNLMAELIKEGAEVLSTEEAIIDGYFTIVRKFNTGVEVHLIPNTTKVQ